MVPVVWVADSPSVRPVVWVTESLVVRVLRPANAVPVGEPPGDEPPLEADVLGGAQRLRPRRQPHERGVPGVQVPGGLLRQPGEGPDEGDVVALAHGGESSQVPGGLLVRARQDDRGPDAALVGRGDGAGDPLDDERGGQVGRHVPRPFGERQAGEPGRLARARARAGAERRERLDDGREPDQVPRDLLPEPVAEERAEACPLARGQRARSRPPCRAAVASPSNSVSAACSRPMETSGPEHGDDLLEDHQVGGAPGRGRARVVGVHHLDDQRRDLLAASPASSGVSPRSAGSS